MEILETATIVSLVLISIAMIVLILLQQGKGAEMGASFGAGASQTVFGSSGSGSFLSRLTSWLAVGFFAASFGLAVIASHRAEQAQTLKLEAAPAVELTDPASSSTDTEALDTLPTLDEGGENSAQGSETDDAASELPDLE